MILLALIICFLCLVFASSSYSSATFSFMKPSRSFSSKMSMILYFHALKFSAPSSFSSSLVLFVILNKMRTSNGNRRNSTYLEKLLLADCLQDDLGFGGKTLFFQMRSLIDLIGGKYVPPQGDLDYIFLFLSLVTEP